MSQTTEPLDFTVPLSFEAHSLAQLHHKQQSNHRKAKQVYLNSLAVYAVNFYLQCLGFETDLEESDSRNPICLKFMDVADLLVKQLGKLECRPVLPDAQVCQIPPEVHSDRAAYVAVQLNPSLKEATIIGFTPTAAEEIPLEKLRSLSEFPQYLHSICPSTRPVQNLRKWLEEIVDSGVDSGWETIESLLGTNQLSLAPVRSTSTENLFQTEESLKRAKIVDLGVQLGQQKVVLALAVGKAMPKATALRKESPTIKVGVRVYPHKDVYLPPELELIMLDDSGNVLQRTEAGEHYNQIRLREFRGQKGDRFTLKVALNEIEVSEEFVL